MRAAAVEGGPAVGDRPASGPWFLHSIDATERWTSYTEGPDGRPVDGFGLELPAGARIISVEPEEYHVAGDPVTWEEGQTRRVLRWRVFFVLEHPEAGS